MPPMPEITETPLTPPTENITPPEPQTKPEETKPDEQPIEIGSLGASSFTSYNQEDLNDNSPKSKKSKKIKTVSAVLGVLLIIAALPLTLLLVKQRQELRKEAETPGLSGSVALCGIKVSPIGQNAPENGNYSFSYSITSTDGKTHTAEVHTYGCACNEASRGSCGTESGQCDGNSFTINTPHTGTVTAPKIGDCGTYQADVFILSVDGNSGCYTNK
jgi:hypothetical protein